MTSDDKIGLLSLVAVIAVVGGAVLGGYGCQVNRNRAIVECVKAGKPPTECSVSIDR